ncbi:MAG: gas vesicle protein GvpG [Chloroflexi bacterium]|nr:gas vesicle protein GvpG [Chloroflexota bacterium]
MGIVANIVTLPATGPMRLVLWLARTVQDELNREALDESRIRAALVDLIERYDAGDLADEEYDHQERTLLAQLDEVRERKAGQARQE